MHNYHKQTKNPSTPSTGVKGMLNRAFWGKKSLKAKNNALKKDVVEKAAGQGSVEKVLEKDED